MFPPQYSSRRPRFSLSFPPFFIVFSASSRRNVGTSQGLEKLVKMCLHLHLRIWWSHPGSVQTSKGVGGKKISVYLQFKTISKIASSFSFCKGAVTRLPLKCDRSTMGRDLEEVQWHYSLPDFCLLSVLPASSHTETLFIHLWTQQGWITQTYHLKLDNTKTPKN